METELGSMCLCSSKQILSWCLLANGLIGGGWDSQDLQTRFVTGIPSPDVSSPDTIVERGCNRQCPSRAWTGRCIRYWIWFGGWRSFYKWGALRCLPCNCTTYFSVQLQMKRGAGSRPTPKFRDSPRWTSAKGSRAVGGGVEDLGRVVIKARVGYTLSCYRHYLYLWP